MLDMADDVPFATAFETHMGISVSDYEDHFFELMDEYLPEGGAVIPIMPLGLSAAVIAVLCFAGQRAWRNRRSSSSGS